jgi:hypothetical protein
MLDNFAPPTLKIQVKTSTSCKRNYLAIQDGV